MCVSNKWLSLIFLVAKRQVKRTFVTTHQLQQQMTKKANQGEKSGRRNTQKLPLEATRKSPRFTKKQETNDKMVSEAPASARRKLDLEDTPHEKENMGENELEV